jgi:hypothetical protein
MLLHRGDKAEVVEDAVRRRHERLADVRAREELALEDDALDPSLREVSAHPGTGWTTPQDSDVEVGSIVHDARL